MPSVRAWSTWTATVPTNSVAQVRATHWGRPKGSTQQATARGAVTNSKRAASTTCTRTHHSQRQTPK
jgi:hypothetical protein